MPGQCGIQNEIDPDCIDAANAKSNRKNSHSLPSFYQLENN